MAILRMSIAHYNDLRRAQKEGNKDVESELLSMGYNPGYREGDSFKVKNTVVEAPKKVSYNQEVDEEEVMNDISSGMDNKEIREKHGISTPKLTSIKKGMK